jgi:hypothetical protein
MKTQRERYEDLITEVKALLTHADYGSEQAVVLVEDCRALEQSLNEHDRYC